MRTGPQPATVLATYLKENPRNSNMFLEVHFELDGGEKIAGSVWFTPAAMAMARKSVKAIGFDIDQREIMDLESDPFLLRGNKCQVDIQEEEYKGKAELRVKWINPLGAGKSEKTMRDLTQALRAAKKKNGDDADGDVSPGVSHIPPEERAALQKQAEDEDIPF